MASLNQFTFSASLSTFIAEKLLICWDSMIVALNLLMAKPISFRCTIAFDHMNEIFVGLFKRMARIGTPTHESLTRISKNLKFLRDNWESLTEASDVSGKKGRHTKARRLATDFMVITSVSLSQHVYFQHNSEYIYIYIIYSK